MDALIQEHVLLALNVKLLVLRIQQHYLVLGSMEKQIFLIKYQTLQLEVTHVQERLNIQS